LTREGAAYNLYWLARRQTDAVTGRKPPQDGGARSPSPEDGLPAAGERGAADRTIGAEGNFPGVYFAEK